MYPSDTIAIVDTISSPPIASLLSVHPNDVTQVYYKYPSHWSAWWTWASDYAATHPPAWLQLMRYLTRPRDDEHPSSEIPAELRSLVDAVRALQLQRTPSVYETCPTGDRSYRISPKKEHEVDRMSSYIHHMVRSESPRAVWHAVDVGSGQGYLSRALQELGFHVLALDNNEHHTSGASQWTTKEAAHKLKRDYRSTLDAERNLIRNASSHPRTKSLAQEDTGQLRSWDLQTPIPRKGSLTHRTVHVSPRTLEGSIAEWLVKPPGTQRSDGPDARQKPIPLMLVALHACGSLTIDVLRTFLSGWARRLRGQDIWTPHSLVVVGCCYNLMFSSDFPLSEPLRNLDPIPKLTTSAVHLAAQVPSQWLKNEEATRDAELALRKVVYRALLQPVLQAATSQLNAITDHETRSERPLQPGLGETQENRRLGKLNNRAYQDWHTFLEHATSKLGIDLAAISSSLPEWFTDEAVRLKMESALFVLQTLRCILGPLIETLILLDRRDWIQHEITEMNDCGQEVEVEMVNLFDQAAGSGRNVALVIKPATIPRGASPMIERN